MEYVPKHCTENHFFLMVLMVKSRWFVMVNGSKSRFICESFVMVLEFSVMVLLFFKQGCLIVFI